MQNLSKNDNDVELEKQLEKLENADFEVVPLDDSARVLDFWTIVFAHQLRTQISIVITEERLYDSNLLKEKSWINFLRMQLVSIVSFELTDKMLKNPDNQNSEYYGQFFAGVSSDDYLAAINQAERYFLKIDKDILLSHGIERTKENFKKLILKRKKPDFREFTNFYCRVMPKIYNVAVDISKKYFMNFDSEILKEHRINKNKTDFSDLLKMDYIDNAGFPSSSTYLNTIPW